MPIVPSLCTARSLNRPTFSMLFHNDAWKSFLKYVRKATYSFFLATS